MLEDGTKVHGGKTRMIRGTLTRWAAASLCCLAVLFALGGCSGSDDAGNAASGPQASGELMTGQHTAVISVEGYGDIDVVLDADSAPVSVTNFCNLVRDGYYDGLAFYRIVDDFCLQGGTLGNSASGYDATLDPIVGEFSQNGIDNPLADNFTRGTIAMARTSDPDSATSTFFITLADSDNVKLSLNGQYAAFGQVGQSGMQVVDDIAQALASVPVDQNGIILDESAMPIITKVTITS